MKRIFLAHLHLKKERERKKRIFSSRFKSFDSKIDINCFDSRCIISSKVSWRIRKRMKRIFLAHLHLKKERERKKRIFSSRFKSLTSIVKLVLIASIDPRCIIYLAMKFYSWDVEIIQYRFQHFANYNPKRRTNSFRIELRSIWLRFLPNQYFINANVSFQNFEKSLGHDRSNRYDSYRF